MHPYPPWHPDWKWDDAGTLFCPVILPAIGLLVAAIVIFRSRTGVARLKSIVVAVAVAFCWPFLPWPVVANARTAAERTACRNNLKEIAHAVLLHSDKQGRLLPPTVVVAGEPPTSWRIKLLPLVSADRPRYGDAPNDADLVTRYDHTRTWDDSVNTPVALRQAQLYRCPSNRVPQDSQQRWYSAYAFLTGPGSALPPDGPLTLGQITDGTSNTLLVVEACGQNIVWTEPRDVDISRDALQINAPGNQPGTSAGIGSSYHVKGAQVALADGSVRFLSEQINVDVLKHLTTAAGGESMANVEF